MSDAMTATLLRVLMECGPESHGRGARGDGRAGGG